MIESAFARFTTRIRAEIGILDRRLAACPCGDHDRVKHAEKGASMLSHFVNSVEPVTLKSRAKPTVCKWARSC